MTAKQVLFRSEAREKVLRGATAMADAVRVTRDERTGVQILKRALEAPARQIAENSSVDGGVVVDRMRSGTGALGFDAAKAEARASAGLSEVWKVVSFWAAVMDE